jgi:hypothetical protein
MHSKDISEEETPNLKTGSKENANSALEPSSEPEVSNAVACCGYAAKDIVDKSVVTSDPPATTTHEEKEFAIKRVDIEPSSEESIGRVVLVEMNEDLVNDCWKGMRHGDGTNKISTTVKTKDSGEIAVDCKKEDEEDEKNGVQPKRPSKSVRFSDEADYIKKYDGDTDCKNWGDSDNNEEECDGEEAEGVMVMVMKAVVKMK